MMTITALFSLAFLGVTLAAPMAPMVFPSFTMPAMGNFGSMQALQQLQTQKQKQSQSQGSGAATGDGSADFGSLQSQQTSNTLTNANGTKSQAGSLGACSGGNCGLSGAAQLSAAGQSQKQKQGNSQNIFGTMGQLPSPNLLGSQPGFSNDIFAANAGQNALTSQKQQQQQSQISGASVGQGSAGLGNVSSVQNTQGQTDDKGAQVGSSSLGQGIGTQVGLSGAVQATGSNQASEQEANAAAQNTSMQIARPGCPGSSAGQTGSATMQQAGQSQAQTNGTGAAVGQGSADEGAVNSAQNANVQTDAKGTLVSTNSAGQATGKGLKLGGSTSSSGQQQQQKQQSNAQNTQGFSGSAQPC